MLAGRRAQRKQSLLDLLQPGRIEIQSIPCHFELGLRLSGFAERAIERRQRRIESSRGLVGISFDDAMRRAETGHGAAPLFQLAQRLGDRFSKRAAGPHQLPLARQCFLIVGLRCKGLQFLHGMAQELLVTPRRLGRRPGISVSLLSCPPR